MTEIKIKYIGESRYATYKNVKSHSIIDSRLLWIKDAKDREIYIPLYGVAIFIVN